MRGRVASFFLFFSLFFLSAQHTLPKAFLLSFFLFLLLGRRKQQHSRLARQRGIPKSEVKKGVEAWNRRLVSPHQLSARWARAGRVFERERERRKQGEEGGREQGKE